MASAGNTVSSFASKTKTKKKHFVAQKVKLFRASDPLLSVLMWGVNHSVSQNLQSFSLFVSVIDQCIRVNEKKEVQHVSQPTIGTICWVHALHDHQRSALIFSCLTFSLMDNILFCSTCSCILIRCI